MTEPGYDFPSWGRRPPEPEDLDLLDREGVAAAFDALEAAQEDLAAAGCEQLATLIYVAVEAFLGQQRPRAAGDMTRHHQNVWCAGVAARTRDE